MRARDSFVPAFQLSYSLDLLQKRAQYPLSQETFSNVGGLMKDVNYKKTY
ncbi:MAG: hypothetical protein HFACDABA_01413 [Anaerolineales bacterium]|nr:hypothetical protein [Anaerolineales bacterium]